MEQEKRNRNWRTSEIGRRGITLQENWRVSPEEKEKVLNERESKEGERKRMAI